MAGADEPAGERVTPPTVPISGVDVPDPAARDEPGSEDPVEEAERTPEDPDKAAEDGLA